MSKSESTSDSDALNEQKDKFERLGEHVYLLQKEDNPEAVIVFFHGLLIDESEQEHAFWRTWKMRKNDECWPITLLPKYLEKQKKKDSEPYRMRVLAVSYEGRTTVPDDETDATDDYLLTENFIGGLVLTGFCRGADPSRNVPIILVGHDLGGILIKNFVMEVEKKAATEVDEDKKEKLDSFLENLKAVMFYATPHSGSPAIEDLAKSIPEGTENRMLKLMSVLGAALARVNTEFTKYRSGRSEGLSQPRFKTYAVVPLHRTNQKGFDKEKVVPEASARNDVDDFCSVAADHFQVCQPEGLWSDCMTKLGQKIHLEISKVREKEEILERCETSTLNLGNHDLLKLQQGSPQLSEANIP